MAKKKSNHLIVVFTQLITDILEKGGNAPMNYKQIAAKLNLTDPESRETILVVLKEETRKGIFIEPQKGKFQLKELKTIITGKVSMTSDGSAFIIPDDEFEEDIYIAPRKVGIALNGDKVRAYVFANRKGKR